MIVLSIVNKTAIGGKSRARVGNEELQSAGPIKCLFKTGDCVPCSEGSFLRGDDDTKLGGGVVASAVAFDRLTGTYISPFYRLTGTYQSARN